MIYPLVRELAADGIPVAVTCRVPELTRQPCYRWLAAPVTAGELVRAYRADALFDAHRADALFDAHRDDPVRRCTTTRSTASSPPRRPTGCG